MLKRRDSMAKYKCKYCDELFGTHQELGGHVKWCKKKNKKPKKKAGKVGRPKKKKAKKKAAPENQIFEITPVQDPGDDDIVIPIRIKIIVEVRKE